MPRRKREPLHAHLVEEVRRDRHDLVLAVHVLVAHERAVLERVKSVTSTCVASVVEGDRVAINWVFEFIYHSGKTGRFDEVALQEWRGDRISRERFFYDPGKPAV